ncbi:MAG: iron ABC transporter permease [Acidimicrobiia bacterium]|nr:iron ABC transporter permease [Acidimicrobiia bacterium]
MAPIGALAVTASAGSPGLWQELLAYVLPAALRDTLVLLVGVALLAGGIGTGTAWLVTAYEFPGRRIADWALLLPLAVPTYIVAFAYLDLLHPIGPVQTAIRALLGIESPRDFRLPDIRSMTGCTILLGFVLYPYVYLTTRAIFLMQSANLMDAARTLGVGRWSMFIRVGLPLARPAIAVGLSLALLEALNDIGAAEFLGVRTLTVSIYTTWVTRSDLPGAAQISLALVTLALALLAIERYARRQRRYANDAQQPRPAVPRRLRGLGAAGALAACAVSVGIGFLIPFVHLANQARMRIGFAGLSPAVVSETLSTVTLALIATAITVGAGLVVAYAAHVSRGRTASRLRGAASIGYAVPGTVLAIGVLPIVTGIEALTDDAARRLLGASTGLFMIGSGSALVYAYGARFLALAAGALEAGFSRISPSLDAAARTLGEGAGGRLWRIHLPLVRPAAATAALLVFVDVMKELPATLILRPLGVETLATHLYGEAVRGTYEDAAIAALLIVVAGLMPVVMLARVSRARAADVDSLL